MKKYRCPVCGKMEATQEHCVCDACASILIDDAMREMYGDDADFLDSNTGDR